MTLLNTATIIAFAFSCSMTAISGQALSPCPICFDSSGLSTPTLTNPESIITAKTVWFIEEDTTCSDLNFRTQGFGLNPFACSELRASQIPEICGCSVEGSIPVSSPVEEPSQLASPTIPLSSSPVAPTAPVAPVTFRDIQPFAAPETAPVQTPLSGTSARDSSKDDNLSDSAIVVIIVAGIIAAVFLLVLFMTACKSSSSRNNDRNLPDSHTDPFATRDGRTLLWKNVNMILSGKSSNDPDRILLQNVWGEVPSKQTTAIMGPSGAGKSSLLNILAGRASSHGNLKIQADIRLNNYSVDPTNIEVRQHIAFVAQDDSLQVTSTPREAIKFSARLRLPRSITDDELNKLTQRVLDELGLATCADTIVGGALIKGISGGERKRTSVGVELVVKPSLIFLDEPTSGLDSFSAVQLCQVLKKVANAGASVLFTIHQPNSEIFNSFDRLILMNKGRVMYQGSVEDVPEYFGDRGHPNPPTYNPADWIMQVAQSIPLKQLDDDGFFPHDTRAIGEPFRSDEGHDALGLTISKHPSRQGGTETDTLPPGIGTQVSLLFEREINNLKRDVSAVGSRLGLTVFLGVLIGIIFWDVGESDSAKQSNLNSHFGALIMVSLMSMFGTAQPALLSFPEERPVFLREYSTNHYSVVSYFLSRFTIEAVLTGLQILVQMLITYFMIGLQANFFLLAFTVYVLAMASTALAVLLGCSVEDPKLAAELLPMVFVPQMLFAGFFVRPELIPVWLRWARYLCTLTYAVRILLVLEFEDCSDNPLALQQCDRLLSSIGADPEETWWNWLVLLVLFGIFRLSALFVLKKKASKFL